MARALAAGNYTKDQIIHFLEMRKGTLTAIESSKEAIKAEESAEDDDDEWKENVEN